MIVLYNLKQRQRNLHMEDRTYNLEQRLMIHIEVEKSLEKLIDDVVEKWNFKDVQSFIKFCALVMIDADDCSLGVSEKGIRHRYTPSPDKLKR